jgi:hypothetical protein
MQGLIFEWQKMHGISGRVLQLTNKSSVQGEAFKYKEKNLEVLYTTKP